MNKKMVIKGGIITMQRLCPNCGDPVEPEEVFCDKCGTKVATDAGEINQYQTPTSNAYQNQYQTPTPNPYQNQYQTPTPNANQNQYSYMPGQQQNIPPYTPPPQPYTPQYSQYQKPKTGSKVLKIVFIVVAVLAILIVALGIIGMLAEDKDDKTTSNSSKPTTSENSKPTIGESSKPAENNNTSTNNNTAASDKMLVTWDGNINVNTNYNADENKIYVEYSLDLKNIGNGDAQNINVYLDPGPNDENAEILGMKPRTIVNYEGVVKEIKQGQKQEIKTSFFYSDIDASKATQDNLQEIANRYLKFPVLIEWYENGKKFSDRKVPQ